MSELSFGHGSGSLIQNPTLGTGKFTPEQRDIICKALRVHAARLYFRLQFGNALLYAELALLQVFNFGLHLAIVAKALFKKSFAGTP